VLTKAFTTAHSSICHASNFLLGFISCVELRVLPIHQNSIHIALKVATDLWSATLFHGRLSQQTWLVLYSALEKPCVWWRTRLRGATYLTWIVQAQGDLVPLQQLC